MIRLLFAISFLSYSDSPLLVHKGDYRNKFARSCLTNLFNYEMRDNLCGFHNRTIVSNRDPSINWTIRLCPALHVVVICYSWIENLRWKCPMENMKKVSYDLKDDKQYFFYWILCISTMFLFEIHQVRALKAVKIWTVSSREVFSTVQHNFFDYLCLYFFWKFHFPRQKNSLFQIYIHQVENFTFIVLTETIGCVNSMIKKPIILQSIDKKVI